MSEKTKALSEFGLIEMIRRRYQTDNRTVLTSIGDDAAVFSVGRGRAGLLTIDTLVEGVHFDFSYTSYADLGHKALAANLSDVSAMGGKPILAVVSLTLPRGISRQSVGSIYAGIRKLAARYQVALCGGDTVAGEGLSVTIAVYGEADRGNVGLRSGVRPGDAVLVTGSLGASQAGLDLLKSKIKNRKTELTRKHLRPEPRIAEAQLLASCFKLHGMIDISDGLASELHHLARESRVGLEIDQGALPIAPEALEAAGRLSKDPLEYCLYGGEEYELLFTLPGPRAGEARALLRRRGMECRVIGQAVIGGKVCLLRPDLGRSYLPDRGYTHRFR